MNLQFFSGDMLVLGLVTLEFRCFFSCLGLGPEEHMLGDGEKTSDLLNDSNMFLVLAIVPVNSRKCFLILIAMPLLKMYIIIILVVTVGSRPPPHKHVLLRDMASHPQAKCTALPRFCSSSGIGKTWAEATLCSCCCRKIADKGWFIYIVVWPFSQDWNLILFLYLKGTCKEQISSLKPT